MIRIVGLQRDLDPRKEFVLLQNQGSMRVCLKGHALLSESSSEKPTFAVIREDACLMPGQYALIRTCSGTPRWDTKTDGYPVYYVYLGENESLWTEEYVPVHILAPQHSYCERTKELLML